MRLVLRGKAALRKNVPPLKALLRRQYPAFVYSRAGDRPPDTVPVFHFHRVDPGSLDQKLAFLKENGYETLDSSEWFGSLPDTQSTTSKRALLTFDDGDISLFEHAFPLLKKYDFKAVSFICPALVPEQHDIAPTAGRRRLCGWTDIREMHDSGCVDFQSHSLRHDLIFSSGRLTGFLHPSLECHYFGKQDRALVLEDGVDFSLTNIRAFEDQQSPDHWGAPVFTLSPRLATDRRFLCNPEISIGLRKFVSSHGHVGFFRQRNWQGILRREFLNLTREYPPGKYTLGEEYQRQNRRELRLAMEMIEERLPRKKVQHFCAPWYTTTRAALATASSTGYVSAFLGASDAPSRPASGETGGLITVRRLPSSFIRRLPGRGRRSLLQACMDPA